MLYGKHFQKKSDHLSRRKLYSSIDDLPQWNWNQVHLTGNYSYLKKLTTYRNIDLDNSEQLKDLWNTIYNEFLDEFGLSDMYLSMQQARINIALLKVEFIKTGDRSLLNDIEIEELDFKNEFKEQESIRLETLVIEIEKRQSFPIDPKTITVYKYNNYLRTFKEEKNGK